MRARVHQKVSCGLYWGQVWDEKKGKWKTVTMSCFTKAGCKLELKRWAKKHRAEEEFEI